TLFATHYFELTRLAEEFPLVANVHLRAVEHKNQIVFLHAVNDGPASQSYGLQVAALAGVPESVILKAREYLVRLEQEASASPRQQDLFYQEIPCPGKNSFPGQDSTGKARQHTVLALLGAIAPDDLSPRQALEQLYALKKAMEE